MSRKKFIESKGATCRNWNWSWSFVNHVEHFVIFGAWDVHTEGGTALILDDTWTRNYAGKKNPGYLEAQEYIRLVEEEGYSLMTFTIFYSDELKDEDGKGPSKIKGFDRQLIPKVLKRVGGRWYAADPNIERSSLPEEVVRPERYVEGASRRVTVNAYERSSAARSACIAHYGAICAVCEFDFEAMYGSVAAGYIHVHHLVPLSEIREEYVLDPVRDLRPVCPNCHAVIHSTQPALTIEQLKHHIEGMKEHVQQN